MSTDNEQYRAQLLAAAQRVQDKQQAREANFRVFMSTRLGVGAGTAAAEEILSVKEATELSMDQLCLLVQSDLGLPADYFFSEDQLCMVLEGQSSRGLGTPPD